MTTTTPSTELAAETVVTAKCLQQPPENEGCYTQMPVTTKAKGGRPRKRSDRCYGCRQPIANDAPVWFFTYRQVGGSREVVFHHDCGLQEYNRIHTTTRGDRFRAHSRIPLVRYRCDHCGRKMVMRQSSARLYCSDACRQAAYRKRLRP